MGTGNAVGDLFRHGLLEVKGIDTVHDILQYLVGHLLLAGIVDMQEVGNTAPEAGNGLTDTSEDTLLPVRELFNTIILLQTEGFHKTLMAAYTAVVCQCLFGNVITKLQVRIVTAYLLPLRGVTHHHDDVLPLLGVLLAQHLGPQMGVLVDGCLCSGNIRVNEDGAVTTDETVHPTA